MKKMLVIAILLLTVITGCSEKEIDAFSKNMTQTMRKTPVDILYRERIEGDIYRVCIGTPDGVFYIDSKNSKLYNKASNTLYSIENPSKSCKVPLAFIVDNMPEDALISKRIPEETCPICNSKVGVPDEHNVVEPYNCPNCKAPLSLFMESSINAEGKREVHWYWIQYNEMKEEV